MDWNPRVGDVWTWNRGTRWECELFVLSVRDRTDVTCYCVELHPEEWDGSECKLVEAWDFTDYPRKFTRVSAGPDAATVSRDPTMSRDEVVG